MKFPIFQQHIRNVLTLAFADIFLVSLSFSLAIMGTRFLQSSPIVGGDSRVYFVYITLFILVIALFYVLGLYDDTLLSRKCLVFVSVCIALFLIIVIFNSLSFFILHLNPRRTTYILFYFLAILLMFSLRLLYNKITFFKPVNILFIIKDDIIKEINNILLSIFSRFYNIVNICDDQTLKYNIADLYDQIKNRNIGVVIYSPHFSISKEFANFLLDLRLHKISVYSSSDFYQRLTGKTPLHHLDEYWVLLNSEPKFFFPQRAHYLKRMFDLVICLMIMPVALLLIMVSALAIKLTSRGPVFFVQERLGKNEVPFQLIKLRTMVADAEKFTGPQWASANDPRITRVGRILRKLRFDEIPQIFNVMRGDMSVIGPRPISHHFADLLAQEIPHYRLRFLVKPGLTGWAQVNHDYAGSKEGQQEKLQYEVFYLVHQSFLLDLFILIKTVKIMVWGKGN